MNRKIIKCKEIAVYGAYANLDDEVNNFLATLNDSDEIFDIQYSTTSHPMDVPKIDEKTNEKVTVKDFILRKSVLITYVTEV